MTVAYISQLEIMEIEAVYYKSKLDEMPDATPEMEWGAAPVARSIVSDAIIERVMGFAVGPDETIEEAQERAEDAENQSRVRGDCLCLAVGQLVESEETRKRQALVIRRQRAAYRRRLLAAVVGAGVVGILVGKWAL